MLIDAIGANLAALSLAWTPGFAPPAPRARPGSALSKGDTLTIAAAPLDPPVGAAPVALSPRQLQQILNSPIRVGILVERPLLEVKSTAPATLYAGATAVATLDAAHAARLRFEAGMVAVYGSDGKRIAAYAGPLTAKLDATGDVEAAEGTPVPAIVVDNRAFRGELDLEVDPETKSGLNAINRVELDDYLYGVVPAEMPATWHAEALKAQAVAARTYAVANVGRRGDRGFDLYATTADQVYKGIAGEAPAATKAVDQTSGVVITHNGQPINALFHANSGGHTEDVRDVWGFSLPYIKGVPDFDQSATRFRWTQTFDAKRVAAVARQLGAEVGDVTGIEPLAFTPHQRVSRVRVIGTTATAELDGNKFRLALGLNSTLYKVSRPAAGSFQFDGQGWGHGLGLSQYGARQLAEDGKTFEQILQHYYTGVELRAFV